MPSRCPSCQSVYDSSERFCALDGAALVPFAPPVPAVAPAAGSGLSGVLIGVLGTLVVALGVAVAFLALRPDPAPVAATPVVIEGQGEPLGAGGVAAEGIEMASAEAPPPRDLERVGQVAPAPRRSAAEFGPARVETDGAGLLLRGGPGREYPVLGKMLPGDVVTVQGCDGNRPGRRWCSVVYGGILGYALDEYLGIGVPARDTDSGLEQAFAASDEVGQWASVDGYETNFINLRERPFVGSDVLKKMRPGDSVYVSRCLAPGWSLGGQPIEGRWCFVTTEGGRAMSGWASDGALRW